MHSLPASGRSTLLATVLVGLAIWITPSQAHSASGNQDTNEIRIVELQGTAEISPAGTTRWVLTQTNQILRPSDKLRTGPQSRVALRWSDQSVASFGALTVLEILPPHEPGAANGLNLIGGLLSFFHRDPPGRIRIITRGGTAGVKGTEFVVAVETLNGTERTTLSVIDGTVQFGNDQDSLTLTNSQQAVAELGKAPVRTAGFIANNVLQWCFYYPAVLDLRDLSLTAEEERALSDSLEAYRKGDLLKALASYPIERVPGSDSERVYHAALLLAIGQVDQTEASLATLPVVDPSGNVQRLATALRQLIAAVKFQTAPSNLNPQLSTELLAASYYEQSRAVREESLSSALNLARQSAMHSPQFGFALARVAELEFSFGRTARALEALNQSLELSPRNAQALALKGFLLAAENKTREAIDWFNQAIAVDSALGNAWLGRGLCRIRHGDATGGREDLLVAAALEPQRSLLRSYLGKGYSDAGGIERARHEFDLAKHLDSADPTPWLYSALLSRQENQINAAVNELEQSIRLNDNRRVYRSKLLLDQDRAVRGASLASLYREAGMPQVSVREAASAVTYDYANYSAHLFLANSFDLLRDPTRFNLRYETAWFNELLLANLLAPVGAGTFSQNISQQEYTRLFDRKRIGLTTTTDVRSDGQYREQASLFGTVGNFGYSLDLDYQHNDTIGDRGRPNNGLDRIEWYSTLKQQITPQDTALLLVKYEDYHSGDNFQYYDPLDQTNGFRPHFQFDEHQHPIVIGGWHHEWAPGLDTLFLGGRLENEQRFSDRAADQLSLFQNDTGTIYHHDSYPLDVNYHNQLEIYTAELNQVFQSDHITLSAGGRFQTGTFEAQARLENPALVGLFSNPASDASISEGFQRLTAYGYMTVEPLQKLWLTGGLAYDDLTYPRNFRQPPISSGEDHSSQLGPKAAVVWEPLPQAVLRGVFTRSLGGVSLDESYRLEPTQLAGFPQSFRSLISESVVGSVAAPEYETYGLAIDLKFPTRTYAGLQVERLESNVRREIGVFVLRNGAAPFSPDSTKENLEYRENSLVVSLNQFAGDMIVLGISYELIQARLHDVLPEVPDSVIPASDMSANLHQANGYILFNHPSGFFARAESHWYHQGASTPVHYTTPVAGDDFFQHNFFVGYRFAQRRAEIMLGILNLTDQDYHLNPLTVYSELPRERAVVASLTFRF